MTVTTHTEVIRNVQVEAEKLNPHFPPAVLILEPHGDEAGTVEVRLGTQSEQFLLPDLFEALTAAAKLHGELRDEAKLALSGSESAPDGSEPPAEAQDTPEEPGPPQNGAEPEIEVRVLEPGEIPNPAAVIDLDCDRVYDVMPDPGCTKALDDIAEEAGLSYERAEAAMREMHGAGRVRHVLGTHWSRVRDEE